MQRPQSLEFKGVNKLNVSHVMPVMISYENRTSDTPTQRLWPVTIVSPHAKDQQFMKPNINISYEYNKMENRCVRRVISIDQQIRRLNRISNQSHKEITQRIHSGMPQSQSFCQNIYKTPTHVPLRQQQSGEVTHTSRIMTTAYMSPPPNDWITVGNIIPVKRSTSMPGYRGLNTTLNKNIPQTSLANPIFTKKKSGPFQCLKHTIKKSSMRNESTTYSRCDSINSKLTRSTIMSVTPTQVENIMSLSSQFPKETTEKIKTTRSIFKKKFSTPCSTPENSNRKPRGIKKSISLFFSSKSYRTVKSDPSNLDKSSNNNKNDDSSISKNSKHERQFSFKSAARLNHSYESMLHNNEARESLSLCTDSNRSNSYTSVEDDSSLDYSNSAGLIETMCRDRTPSESSLPDTASLTSCGNPIFSYNNINQYNADQQSIAATSCHGNINYRATDNCWKTIVGNVCRSNSKDSAIANSTLSADGMLSQSKRMSQISTVSRTSDITQTSEDFNDSSYSSFNDLQIQASQIYHKRKRVKSILPKLEPIELESKPQDSCNSYENSPLSDSSTETLRPLSCLLRRRFLSSGKDNRPFHSNTTIKQSILTTSEEYLHPDSLKHSHSWPSCHYPLVCKSISSFKASLKPCISKNSPSIGPSTLKVDQCPLLKFGKLNHNRVNNSPLLSQYSRLYSLKSAGMKQQIGLSNVSGHVKSSNQPPVSPIKYSNRNYHHFPS